MSIVTLQEVKDYIGISDNTYDTFLTDYIDLVQTAMENYCNRKFDETTYTQTYYEEDIEFKRKPELYTFHYPLVSISSITEDTTVLTTDEYRAKLNNGKITRVCDHRKLNWFRGCPLVTMVYTAGYTDLNAPRDLKQVIYSLVEEAYNKKSSGVPINFGQDVQRVSVAGVMSIDFDYTLNSNERSSAFGMILGSWGNVLDYYRSERALTGEIFENYVTP